MTAATTTRESWKSTFELIRKMRSQIVAPVDTIGCASLADKKETPQTIRFQILVSLLLSSQTKDEITSAAVDRLKSLPGGLNFQNMIKADETVLEETIKPVGFFRRKAKNLIEISKLIKEQYGGDIPKTADDLMKLPGIGPKMAHLAMQHAWNENSGIGVDVHVHRISNRLGWVRTKNPEETRIELESFLPKEHWKEINHLLVGFGQTICSAKTPHCSECLLKFTCPSSLVKQPASKRSLLKFALRRMINWSGRECGDLSMNQGYPVYPPPAYSTPGHKGYPGQQVQQYDATPMSQQYAGYQQPQPQYFQQPQGQPPPPPPQSNQNNAGMGQGLLAGYFHEGVTNY